MATHSSIVAWRIPWTEEPGGLQSMGSQRRTPLGDFHSCCLFTFGPLSCFDTPTCSYSPPLSQFVSGPSPGCACTPQSRWISSQRHMGGNRKTYFVWHSLLFDPVKHFVHMQHHPCLKDGKCMTP